MPKMTKKRCILVILFISLSLGWRPLGASVSVDKLEPAIAISQQALIAQQQEEGHWFGYVETNTLYNSLQILLYYYLHREEEERETIDELCRYLVNTQSQDGSWPFYEGGSGDSGLTTLNYFALKLGGYQKQDPTLVQARDYIILHGGAESLYVMYKLLLALFDQYYFSLPGYSHSSPHCYCSQIILAAHYAHPFNGGLGETSLLFSATGNLYYRTVY